MSRASLGVLLVAAALAASRDAVADDDRPSEACATFGSACLVTGYHEAFDEIELRDGRRIRGRVIETEPGRWIVLETEDGRRHTVVWPALVEVDLASRKRALAEARSAWRARAGGRPSYELRGELTGMALPSETFGLTGSCATGTGVAPASIYGQTADARGRAVGAGVGGRASYMFISPLDPEEPPRWWALHVGSGLDLQMMYSRAPVGIPPVDGALCSEVATTSHEVAYENSSFLLARVPLSIGAHWGFGALDNPTVWRGVVLGAAWSPSWVHTGPWSAAGASHLNLLGLELTLDFATLHALPRRKSEAHLRIAFSLTIPVDDRKLLMGTLGLGAVWY